MTNFDEKLLPAISDEVAWTLRHSQLFDKRKRFDGSRDYMATIMAARLLEALRQSGFVVMKRQMPPPRNDWPTAPKGD